jgi:cell wall-associated NlpC family hydrolase
MSVEKIIEELRKKYEQNYGFAVFDLSIKEGKDKIIISGQVLTENQKSELVLETEKTADKKVKYKISVLSDMKSKEIGWAVSRRNVADLKSRFVDNSVMNEKILKRVRTSQALKNEVLRVLFKKDDQLLVQSGDLTLGWINRSDVILKKESLRREWRKGIFAEPDKMITVKSSGEKIIAGAEKFFGVKYILGTKSQTAIDCSGLTQCAYKNAFDIILPRHSWDQKKVGKMVDFEKAKTGDLVFMINKKTSTKHVGIIEITKGGKNIIHASSIEGKVVRQPAEKVFEGYESVEVRRVIKN